MANVIKQVANYIRKNPDTDEAATLLALSRSLEDGQSFEIGQLFDMKNKAFELAIELIQDWRLDRHIASRRIQKYLVQEED